jgi:hypothetical protein
LVPNLHDPDVGKPARNSQELCQGVPCRHM